MPKENQQKSTVWQPTMKQQKTAIALATPDTRSITEAAKLAGVDRGTIYNYFKDENFKNYLQQIIDQYTDGHLGTIWGALVRKAETGDVNAIKLFFEMKGKYRQEVKLSGELNFVNWLRGKLGGSEK